MYLKIIFFTAGILYFACINYIPFYLIDMSDGAETKGYFRDGDIIEDIQAIHLILATILLGACWCAFAWRRHALAPLTSFLVIGVAWASIRELDSFFEHADLLPFYYCARYLLILAGAILLLRCFRQIWASYILYRSEIGIVCFKSGVACYILAQILGGALSDFGSDRAVKRILEETVELAGGSLILLSALRFVIAASPILARCWNEGEEAEQSALVSAK